MAPENKSVDELFEKRGIKIIHADQTGADNVVEDHHEVVETIAHRLVVISYCFIKKFPTLRKLIKAQM